MKKLRLFFCAALLLVPFSLQAQFALTIGGNDTVNSNVPIIGSYRNCHSEMVYSFAVLGDMNNAAITGLTFYAAAENSWSTRHYMVYLEEGVGDSYTPYNYINDAYFKISDSAQLVWDGSCSVVDSVWTIAFDQPYHYHGSNLLVHIYCDNSGSSGPSSLFYGNATSGLTSNSTTGSSMTYGGGAERFRPKVTFFYDTAPQTQCAAPTNITLTELSHYKATLFWTAGGNENQWSVYLDGQFVAVTDSAHFTFSNLASDRVYNFAVRARCNGDSSLATPARIRTLADPLTTDDFPFFAGFEELNTNNSTGLGPYWRRINCYSHKGHYPRPSTNDAYNGSKSLYFLAGPHYQPTYAILRGVQSPNTLTLNFWARQDYYYDTRITVGLMTSPVDTSTFVPIEVLAATDGGWNNYTISFSGYAATSEVTYIAFRVNSLTGSDRNVFIDDVQLFRGPVCIAPEEVWLAEASSEDALVRWNAVSESGLYNVSYIATTALLAGSTSWNSLSVEGDSLWITDLLPSTEYTVRVYSICGTSHSQVAELTFRTECTILENSQLPYTDNLESYSASDSLALNPCWLNYSVVNDSLDFYNAPYITTVFPHSGDNSLYMGGNNYQMTASYVVFQRTEQTLDNLYFTCWVRGNGNNGTGNFTIGLMDDPYDPASFVPVRTITAIDSVYRFAETGFLGINDNSHIAIRSYSQQGVIYVDDITIGAPPACPPVYDLTVDGTTDNAAALSWYDPYEVGNYSITYGPVSGGATNTVTVQNITQATLSSLTPTTDYFATVYVQCSSPSEGRTVYFHTQCPDIAASSLPQTFDFENSLYCFSTAVTNRTSSIVYTDHPWQSVDPTSLLTSVTSHSPNHSLRMSSQQRYGYRRVYGATMASLPGIAAPMENLKVNFWYKSTDGQDLLLDVGICDYPADIHSFVLHQTIEPTDTLWHEYEVDFSQFAGTGHYVTFFQHTRNHTANIDTIGYLDDITVGFIPGCAPPTDVAVSDIGATTATITWTGSTLDTYRVRWSPNDSVVVNGATTYTITGLTPYTDYTVGVSRLCQELYYYRNVSFRTQCSAVPHSALPWIEDFESYANNEDSIPCWGYVLRCGNYPYVVNNSSINHTPGGSRALKTGSYCLDYPVTVLPKFEDALENLSLSFYAKGNSGKAIEIGVIDDNLDPESFQSVDTMVMNSFSLENNLFEVTFKGIQQGRIALRVLSIDGDVYFIDDIVVKESPDCPRPSGIDISNITQTSAEVTVSNVGNPSAYMFYWSSPTTSDSLLVEDSIFTISGLVAGTTYNLAVRTMCSDSSLSLARYSSFQTECADITDLPWSENFDIAGANAIGAFPNCWTRDYQCHWYAGSSPANSQLTAYDCARIKTNGNGNKSMTIRGYNNSTIFESSIVALPRFAQDLDSLRFSFRYYFNNGLHRLEVGVLTDSGDSTLFVPIDVIIDAKSTVWKTYANNPADFVGLSGRFALRYTSVGTNTVITVDIDDVSVKFNTSCDRPQNVAVDAGDTYAGITIYDPYGTQDYMLVVSDGSSTDSIEWQTAFDTLRNLEPNTGYTLEVYPLCENGYNAGSFSTTFTTTCEIVTHDDLPYLMDFDNIVANQPLNVSCWSRLSFDSQYPQYPYVYRGIHRGLTGSSTLLVTSSEFLTEWMISPVFDSVNDLELNFWTYSEAPTKITVCTTNYPDDTTTYTRMATLSHTDSAAWQEHTLTLAGRSLYAKYVAFRFASSVPNTYLVVDEIVLNTVAPCPRVQSVGISNLAARSVLVTIDDSSQAASYRISVYRNGNLDTVVVATSDSVLLTGLYPANIYTLYVSSLCTDGTVTTPVSTSFQTLCDVIRHSDLPFIENFDSYIPNGSISPCWKVFKNAGGVAVPDGAYNHGNSAGVCLSVANNCDGGDGTYVILPDFDSVNDLFLTFWMRQYYYGWSGATVTVGVLTTAGDTSTYIPLEQCEYHAPVGTWQQCEVALSNYQLPTASNIVIRVCGSGVYLDDVVVEPNTGCTKPGNLVVSGISTTTATVSFTDYNDIGHYRIKLNGDSTDIYTTTYQFTGLDTATSYTLSVATVCPNGRITQYLYTDFCTLLCDSGTTAYIGDAANGYNGTRNFPVSTEYRYSLSQTIVDADELGGPMDIGAIAFSVVGNNAVSKADNVLIYLQTTDQSVFDENAAPAPLNDTAELVYRGHLNAVPGVNFFNFDGVYHYNGVGNILVTVIRNQGQYTNEMSYFNTYGTGSRKTLYCNTDFGPINPATIQNLTPTVTVNSRAEMQLISCGEGCQRPRFLHLDTVDIHNATLSWGDLSDEYFVSYRATADDEWSDEVTLTANTYTLSSLLPNTEYEFRVRTFCDNDIPSGYTYCSFVTENIPAPTSLQAIDLDFRDATLEWMPDTTHSKWVLHVWNNGYNQFFDTDSIPFTVTALSQNTTYNAAVKGVYANDITESDYSDTISFATEYCHQVTGITATALDPYTAVVRWEDFGAQEYNVNYGLRGTQAGQGRSVIVYGGDSCVLTNLKANAIYWIYVRATCATGITGSWSALTEVVTPEVQGIEVADGATMDIYPNPTSGRTTIALTGATGEVRVTVVDINGRVMISDTMSCSGDCTKTMELSALAPGTYFVNLTSDNINFVKKLVVK